MAEDPFIQVKEDVIQTLTNASALFKRWGDLVNDPARDTEEFDWTSNELKNALKSIEWDLDDLSETVAIVEQDPSRFKLPSQEIIKRKDFIASTRQKVKEMKDQTSSSVVKSKTQQQQRGALLGETKFSRYNKLEKEIENQNQNFIENEEQAQATIMRQQDTQLEEVGQTINVLKTMGETIGQELDEQNDMLDDFNEEMTTVGDRLTNTLKKLDKALDLSKDGKQTCCIVLLLLAIIILIVIYLS